jgi:hypothetical protein
LSNGYSISGIILFVERYIPKIELEKYKYKPGKKKFSAGWKKFLKKMWVYG